MNMTDYCIGDLHGCYSEFMRLLDKIDFDESRDTLWLTGDLIGRGPEPLKTLSFIIDHKDRIHPVLGNHDMNFLAVAAGEREARAKDNLGALLKSDRLPEFVHYYYSLPFIDFNDEMRFAICHAGIHPLWDLSLARKLSKELSKILRDDVQRPLLLRNMYRDYPSAWDKGSSGMLRWRFAINVFTRMRLLNSDLSLDYGHSSSSPEAVRSEGLRPWFEFLPDLKRHKQPFKLCFGHWAALNARCSRNDIIALDTGCVWGGSLSCYDCVTGERVRVESEGHLKHS